MDSLVQMEAMALPCGLFIVINNRSLGRLRGGERAWREEMGCWAAGSQEAALGPHRSSGLLPFKKALDPRL